jgi:hypothetical protein
MKTTANNSYLSLPAVLVCNLLNWPTLRKTSVGKTAGNAIELGVRRNLREIQQQKYETSKQRNHPVFHR